MPDDSLRTVSSGGTPNATFPLQVLANAPRAAITGGDDGAAGTGLTHSAPRGKWRIILIWLDLGA